MVGRSQGGSIGVLGFSGSGAPPAPTANTGVYGYAPGVGVRGVATNGRGGVFSGPTAQLRLVPSTAATHPASGTAGDLFMDKSNRLWLCKGTTSWVQLA